MLSLHIGLPGTGTTSLQTVLEGSAAVLAEAHTVYPDRWRDWGGLAHHELASSLLAGENAPAVQDDFLRYLGATRSQRSIVISTEGLSNGLTPQKFPLFRSFLRACASVTPVRLVLTLRRYDAFVSSMYQHQLKWGQAPNPDIDRYAALRQSWISGVFKTLGDLRRDGDVASLILVPYVEGADSIALTLDALDLSWLLSRSRPPARLGRSIGLKALALLRFFDECAAEDRLPVERRHLVQLFERRRFEFPNEEYGYDILGSDVKRALHEHALSAAGEFGIAEYQKAYGEAVIERSVRQAVDRRLISADDVDRLARYLARLRPGSRPGVPHACGPNP